MGLDEKAKATLKLLEERLSQYSKCEMMFSLTKVNNEYKIYNGAIVFFHAKDVTEDKTRLTYNGLILDRQLVSAADGNKAVNKLMYEGKITLDDFGEINLETTGINDVFGRNYVPAYQQYGYAYSRFDWPCRRIDYNIKTTLTNLINLEMANVESPLYPSAGYAIADFMNGIYPNNPIAQRIEIIIPDYRARIRKALMLDDRVEFEIEERETKIDNLMLKYFIEARSGIKSGQSEIVNGSAMVKYPEDLIFLEAVIIDINKNEAVDTKYLYPFRLESWQELTDQSYTSLIDKARSGKENKNLELKEKLNDKGFFRSVSAFANTEGGVIILGITDKSREIVGCSDSDDTITRAIASNTEPPVEFTIKDITYSGKKLKVLEIPEGPNKPYMVRQKGIFIRRNGISEQITRVELEEIIQKRATSRLAPLI